MQNILVTAELIFSKEDLKKAKAWWKKQRYSKENDANILISAALAGIIDADVESASEEYYDDI